MQIVKCLVICIITLRTFKTQASNFFLSHYLLVLFELSMNLCVTLPLSNIYLTPVYAIEYSIAISSFTCLHNLVAAFPAEL